MEKIIDEAKEILSKPYKRYENLDQIFIKIKNIASEYFDGIKMNDEYCDLINELNKKIMEFPAEYICDTTFVFRDLRGVNNNVNFSKKRTTYSIEDYLDYVVYYARKQLICNQDLRKHYDKYDVTNMCWDASNHVNEGAKLCDLKCHVIRIDPGFDEDSLLFNGCGYHYFNIIEHNNKYYLVDVSYKQFFTKDFTSFEIMGVPFVFTPMAGIYMTLDKFRNQVATTLNKYGWIELTDEVLKAYLDGFALSYRNALYYEDKEIKYETAYTAKDYKNFLMQEDSQVRHEGTRVLGYQREPIKNPNRSYKVR